MERKLSEFSYGFALTHELVNRYGFLLADAPVFPSLVEEGKSGGFDVGIPRHGHLLFLQFKVSEYMKGKNAAERNLLGLPYFRFALHRKNRSDQHRLLIRLEKDGAEDGAEVRYAAPRFYGVDRLNGAFFYKQMVAESIFVSPLEIGELPDNKEHRVVFSNGSSDVYFCSRPKKLQHVIDGNLFEETIHKILFDRKPRVLDEGYFENLVAKMISIASPNRRIFDELSAGKVEMSASTFANYLAKTLFDCELLIVPS